MPYIFIGDKSPEARDYDNNYIFYDEDNIESMEFALEVIKGSKKIDRSLALIAQTTIEKALKKKRAVGQERTVQSILNKFISRISLL